MSNFQHHAKKRMGDPSIASAKYKATERFSFGWTDPRALFRKGELVVTTEFQDFLFQETFTLTHNDTGRQIKLNIEKDQSSQVERLPFATLKNLWLAAFSDSPVTYERLADDSFMSAVFLRLCRAGHIETNTMMSSVKLKNANSPEQSAVAAY